MLHCYTFGTRLLSIYGDILDPPPKKDSFQFIISALSAVSFAAVITFGLVTNVLSPLWTNKGGTFLCLTNNDCEEDLYN